jgi:hypothetical protein
MSEGTFNIRETVIGECIGATILDITTIDTDEFLTTGENEVYFHLSNGKTLFATMGTEEAPGLIGMVDMDATDDDPQEAP